MQDRIDRLYKRKKFFMQLYKEAIGSGNNLVDNQYIRVFQVKDDFKKVTFWNNIDDLNSYIEDHRFNANSYFNLATTNGNDGTEENLKYRYFLAWDFDKKLDNTINTKEIMFRFKKLELWYHAIVDSGNGFHVYMCINKTDDFNKVMELTKAIGQELGADQEAMLKTQVLRVPLTFNLKDKPKQVNIVNMFDKNVKPYDVDRLYKRFCKKDATGDRTIQYALNKTNFPPCILSILKGVLDGDRNFALKRLISFLKLYKYSQSEAWNIVKEWSFKNKPPMTEQELEYQFNYIWDKEYSCFGCVTKDETLQAQIKSYCDAEKCKNTKKDSIQFVEGETIQMEYKICKKLTFQRKGVFQLRGNHLLLIGVLKNQSEGLCTNEIINNLTYKNKCCICKKTLSNTLNELTENGYVIKIPGNKRKKEKDFYKINAIKCEEMEKFNLSYFAVLGVIKEDISPEDFKIYCYMRYKLSKKLSVVQEKLAEELGVSQQAISVHINNLVREKYLELKYVDYSNNPLGVNIYRVNC